MWFSPCSNADTEVKNLDGKTALEVAELNAQTGVVTLMKAHASASIATAVAESETAAVEK